MLDRVSGSDGTAIESLLHTSLKTPAPLHISLSASLSLRTQQRDGFLDQLSNAIHRTGVCALNLRATGLDWFANESRTRWFLVLKLSKPENDSLNLLLRVCNETCKSWGQSELYKTSPSRRYKAEAQPPQPIAESEAAHLGKKAKMTVRERSDNSSEGNNPFHISIGWSLEQPKGWPKVTSVEAALEEIKGWDIAVDSVKVKIGNVVNSVPLRRRSSSATGLLV